MFRMNLFYKILYFLKYAANRTTKRRSFAIAALRRQKEERKTSNTFKTTIKIYELSRVKTKMTAALNFTSVGILGIDYNRNQRTNGPVNAHLISWPSKAQNIQNLENIW